MPKSRSELVRRAWALLFKPAEGEEPSVGDLNVINALVLPVVAQLATSNVVWVGNPEDIDDQVFLPLAVYLANEAAPEFAQSKSEDVRLLAEKDIRRATASRSTSPTLKQDYF